MEEIAIEYAGRPLSINTGHVARQADGSVIVRYADTVVLVTCVAEKRPSDYDFLPLTVNYLEMSYAAGRFPGGFFKREGKPSEREILISRLIDRPLRPLFPKGFKHETQIIATVLSADQENDPAILGIIGASCAITLSGIPFSGPLAGVKIGRKDGTFLLNPTTKEMDESDMEIVVAGTRDAILMVEGAAKFVKTEDLVEAIHFAHEHMGPLIEIQEELKRRARKEPWAFEEPSEHGLRERIVQEFGEAMRETFAIPGKAARKKRQEEIFEAIVKTLEADETLLKELYEEVMRDIFRKEIMSSRRRIDGRSFEQLREISCSVGILPRTHGSALFTRGETQALAVTTFGTSEDEQKVESLLEGETFKSFMVHYNFPPFCVGEVAPLRAPSRREIGHGYLAERALLPILPPKEEFPYTIRIVSEILESNGSSSMATVCSGCLSLMDAGVPIKEPVAGIAMGLIKEGDEEIILSDILGDEDHLGDMDFKIAGGRGGITAVQMDIKIKGISKETMFRALKQAERGIEEILSIMTRTLAEPRKELSPYAPRIFTVTIKPEKIRDLIGPQGKNIKYIIDQTGVKIDIEDTGLVKVVSNDEESASQALELIKKVTREIEIGDVFLGKVKRIMDSGVIVELFPGLDGFVHISQLGEGYIRRITDVVKEGEQIKVKVVEIDSLGRIRLSRKAVLREERRSHV